MVYCVDDAHALINSKLVTGYKICAHTLISKCIIPILRVAYLCCSIRFVSIYNRALYRLPFCGAHHQINVSILLHPVSIPLSLPSISLLFLPSPSHLHHLKPLRQSVLYNITAVVINRLNISPFIHNLKHFYSLKTNKMYTHYHWHLLIFLSCYLNNTFFL